MKNIRAQKVEPGIVAIASGYTIKTRPGPSVATSLMSLPAINDIYPKTEKMTKPERKLVPELTKLVMMASLVTTRPRK